VVLRDQQDLSREGIAVSVTGLRREQLQARTHFPDWAVISSGEDRCLELSGRGVAGKFGLTDHDRVSGIHVRFWRSPTGPQAWPSAPHCSILLSQTDRPGLAPIDDQGYPFSLIVLSANRMEVSAGGGSRVQENEPHSFRW
jgi:hypothetical protein